MESSSFSSDKKHGESQLSDDQYEEFKEYKRKKRSNSVKFLIKKVQTLEKKVKELKNENKAIEKDYQSKQTVLFSSQ